MKYSIALLAAASAAFAQLESLPACGQTCIQNMVGIATNDFGCGAGDIQCYCTNVDFGYGVRDCSNEACTSSDEALQVISFGTNYCAQAIASAGDAASTIVASGLSVLSSAAASATGDSSDDSPASTPVTTSPLEATVTGTDGSTFVTTTGLVTLFGPVDGAATTTGGALDSAASSASDAAGSLISSASDAANSAISSASDAANSAASEASDAAGSATGSEGAAPMMTAAPFLAGAGLAALLLI